MDKYDCIVIGGGAAGMMAAVTAAGRGRRVLLPERGDRCGRKLSITGKGRCNVTNNCSPEEFFGNIPHGEKFLRSAYSRFGSADCMEFFESRGVPLKTERGNRAFPVSDRAGDIVRALEKSCLDTGVTVLTGTRVKSVLTENGAVTGVTTANGEIFYADSVLIATGGKSYPGTGSDGDGYRLAKELGHTVVTPKPSLVPLVAEEGYCAEMMGLSLKNVSLTLTDGKRVLFREQGEMLFTHFGVSGPLVLSASSRIRKMERGRYRLFIDLKPALDEQALDRRVLRDFSEEKNKRFENSLDRLLPRKMVPVIVRLSGIAADKRVNSVTRRERESLVKLLKNFPVTVKDFRPISEAIITSGGVELSEVSPKTMESKLVRGLYFAGEVLDADGYTGGFNLQIAFSTAFAAGSSM